MEPGLPFPGLPNVCRSFASNDELKVFILSFFPSSLGLLGATVSYTMFKVG